MPDQTKIKALEMAIEAVRGNPNPHLILESAQMFHEWLVKDEPAATVDDVMHARTRGYSDALHNLANMAT